MARDVWNATGVGTTAGVTVTKAAVEDRQFAVTSIHCSGDAAAVVTIESPGWPVYAEVASANMASTLRPSRIGSAGRWLMTTWMPGRSPHVFET